MSIFIKSFVKSTTKNTISNSGYQLLAFNIHLRSIRTLTSPQMLKITCSYLTCQTKPVTSNSKYLNSTYQVFNTYSSKTILCFLVFEFGNFGFLSFFVRRCNCLISLKLYHLKPLFGVQLITASLNKLISLVFPSFPTITSTISSPLGKTIN